MTTELIEPVWTLGDRLRKAMDAAELTPADMAVKLENYGIAVTANAVRAWLRDENQPRRKEYTVLDVIDAWAEITGISREWLLNSRWNISPDPQLPLDLAA